MMSSDQGWGQNHSLNFRCIHQSLATVISCQCSPSPVDDISKELISQLFESLKSFDRLKPSPSPDEDNYEKTPKARRRRRLF